ncbi:MAG TPA: GDP-mannose 4,6-dehydratase [Phycisphaerae bacterium]|nr:GDP-mannose 4,6-dehydratase [Phycisphaerae bacterium]
MRALITGGAGFIGSHLAERLLRTGHEVVALDNLSTGRMRNLSNVVNDARFQFVYDDVRNPHTLHVLIAECDVVFHLAAAVGVQLIVDQPVHTIETNIHGSEVVLATANKFRKPVLMASTSEVYGKSENVPFREDDDTVLGSTKYSRWSYACSKAIDEFLGLAYHEQYGLPVVVARFFNTVGPRQTGQYGMVVPRFVERALKNEPIAIYGTGKQSRCFGYVGDVVGAVIDLMNNKSAAGRVYNIGSTEEITIEELADRIIRMTGSKSQKKYLSYQEAYGRPFDDMMRRVPCLDRIRQAVGYEPKTDLNEMLKLIIAEKREVLGRQDSSGPG